MCVRRRGLTVYSLHAYQCRSVPLRNISMFTASRRVRAHLVKPTHTHTHCETTEIILNLTRKENYAHYRIVRVRDVVWKKRGLLELTAIDLQG